MLTVLAGVQKNLLDHKQIATIRSGIKYIYIQLQAVKEIIWAAIDWLTLKDYPNFERSAKGFSG